MPFRCFVVVCSLYRRIYTVRGITPNVLIVNRNGKDLMENIVDSIKSVNCHFVVAQNVSVEMPNIGFADILNLHLTNRVFNKAIIHIHIIGECMFLNTNLIRIMVLTQSLADLDIIYGKDERKAMLGNFKFTVLLGCKDTETQEYFSKMIGDRRSLLSTDNDVKPMPIIKPADLAHLGQ